MCYDSEQKITFSFKILGQAFFSLSALSLTAWTGYPFNWYHCYLFLPILSQTLKIQQSRYHLCFLGGFSYCWNSQISRYFQFLLAGLMQYGMKPQRMSDTSRVFTWKMELVRRRKWQKWNEGWRGAGGGCEKWKAFQKEAKAKNIWQKVLSSKQLLVVQFG